MNVLSFTLPPALEAHEPPEGRGLRRDAVKLLVSYTRDDTVEHRPFTALPDVLQAGDVLVLNTSGTLNAALPIVDVTGRPYTLHLSTPVPTGPCSTCENHLPQAGDYLDSKRWVVELREPAAVATKPSFAAVAGGRYFLPAGGVAHFEHPYGVGERLWVATLNLPMPLPHYLEQYGSPIRYSYVQKAWGSAYYQNVYATTPGSAEMPSAGRALTPDVITQLVAKGILVVPLLLHTGVASLETHEPPYAEYYEVPPVTAQVVSAARAAGRRVVAVGTTVVRALESVTDSNGITSAGAGWTELIITPERGLRAVTALLTGMHEPQATHLAMLESLAGRAHLAHAYGAAIAGGYLWHEFGDMHLIIGE